MLVARALRLALLLRRCHVVGEMRGVNPYSLSWYLLRAALVLGIIWLARYLKRRREGGSEADAHDEQAELFKKELPKRPNFVVNRALRIACRKCGELVDETLLHDVEGRGKLCDTCLPIREHDTKTYRG